ncbi:MAG TPA: CBS domain-containing protein [Candidatus Excrementavichristensenella intestinipullorum]|nr:CBS domain-containing protein [Candidatus Excrementavichristensenella intestinipullorum]
MNVAFLLIPKINVSYLYDDWTLRQALEKMRHSGYTAIPVLSRDGRYRCTVTLGDFLWYLVDDPDAPLAPRDIHETEKVMLRDIMRPDSNPPVRIDAEIEELMGRALEQNFIPVVDDRDAFSGIVTRRDIIAHLLRSCMNE